MAPKCQRPRGVFKNGPALVETGANKTARGETDAARRRPATAKSSWNISVPLCEDDLKWKMNNVPDESDPSVTVCFDSKGFYFVEPFDSLFRRLNFLLSVT